MASKRRGLPEINAGSMADIAFLLLIFFLVTTTIETDSGISRKLPPMEESEEDVVIKQKNIFTVLLNGKDQLLVEDELMVLENLRESAIEFLDNGGGTGEEVYPPVILLPSPGLTAVISIPLVRFLNVNEPKVPLLSTDNTIVL